MVDAKESHSESLRAQKDLVCAIVAELEIERLRVKWASTRTKERVTSDK